MLYNIITHKLRLGQLYARVSPPMKRTKLLYVITKSNWGGAQKYVFDLATHLPKEAFEVVVAAGGKGVLFQKLHDIGIRTIRIDSANRDMDALADTRSLGSLFRIFLRERPDVVHINSSKIGGLGAFAARVAGIKKIVFTAHGWAFLETRPKWQTTLITFFSWLTAFFATDVIDITQATYDRVRHWPLVGHKMHLIHNGADQTPVTTPNSTIRDSFPKESIVVGTIGELHTNKNQKLLIEAAHHLPENICIAIVGEGEEYHNLEHEIAKYSLQERVKLFGFMSAAEALPNFDIFALPSIKEGLPYVILEAGLASLPVIASNVGGIPDIIEDEKSGLLISKEDAAQLSEEIKTLAQHPNLQKQYGTVLHQKVLSQLSLEQMLTKTTKIYSIS